MLKAHQPRKRFGQNFLHDQNVIGRIIAVIKPQPNDHLVEIGPGQGALTIPLLEQATALDVVELDRDLIPRLKIACLDCGNLTIHQADALKFDFRQLKQDERPLRIIGNLPYNISTPLIFHLLEQMSVIKDMHFMLQKEVVDRMAAQPSTADYGRLSIMVQYFCKPEPLFLVKPGSFTPAPKVESAVIRLTPHAQLPYPVNNFPLLKKIVTQAFCQRRKTLRNCLRTVISKQQLLALDINPQLRPENLALADFVRICLAVE